MLGFALLLLVVFVVFAKSISVLLISIQKYIPSSSVQSILSRFARYLSGEMSPNIKGFLFGSGGHIVSFFLADKMCEIMLDLRKNHALPQQKKYLSSSTISFLRNLNSLMVLIVPCYALSLQFDRFFAYFVPVAYSLIVQGICELKLSREHHAGWFQNSASCNIQGVRTHMYSLDAEYMRSIALFLLLSCLTFCFLVSNWYSGFSEFSRIVTGIARFGGL